MLSFLMTEERSYSSASFLKIRPFQEIWIIYYISIYFFWERSSSIFRLKNKIIFLWKRIIIFPDNTRKIIFPCNIFGKTIFLKHLEKENVVFHIVILLSFHLRFYYFCSFIFELLDSTLPSANLVSILLKSYPECSFSLLPK